MNSDGRRSNLIYRIFFEKKEEETENEKEKGKKKETIIDVCYIKARTTRGRAAIRLTTLPQSIHVFVNN